MTGNETLPLASREVRGGDTRGDLD